MEPWWSEATKLPFATQDGGASIGGPSRGVIHTTEFKTYTPSKTAMNGSHSMAGAGISTCQGILTGILASWTSVDC